MKPSLMGIKNATKEGYMYEPMNQQDAISHEVMEEKVPVDLFLEGGFQIGGIIVSYDSFVIALISAGKQHMV